MQSLIGRIAAAALLTMFAVSAQAISLSGEFGNDRNYSLVHEGSGTPPSNPRADWLFFDVGAAIEFEINGDILTAGAGELYTLSSENGATATFELISLTLDLSGPNGLAGGSLDYTLDGVGGTFVFEEGTFGNGGFNSSMWDGDEFWAFAWGSDVTNDLGIDIAIHGMAAVPLPGAILFLGSAVLLLGSRRRS